MASQTIRKVLSTSFDEALTGAPELTHVAEKVKADLTRATAQLT